MIEKNHFNNQDHNFDIREYQLSFFDNLEFKVIENNFFRDFFNFKKKYLRRIWQIKNYITFKKNNYFVIKNPNNRFNILLFYLFRNKYYIGGWNSINHSTSSIRDEFNKLNISKETKRLYINTNLVDEIKNTNSIPICIRRGDYAKFGISSNLDFFYKAIDFFNNKFSKNNFFIFSDDIDWCKNNFNQINNVHFVNTNKKTPLEDLLLISYCKNAIISKSTFNLLGCYLNNNPNKIIIAERNWDINYKICFQTILLTEDLWVMREYKNILKL